MTKPNENQVAGYLIDPSTALATVTATLKNLMQDWDIDEPIRRETRVVADLGFESIDLIQMVAELERAFRLPSGSLVDMLITGGRYVDDLSVGEIVDGVAARVGRNPRT